MSDGRERRRDKPYGAGEGDDQVQYESMCSSSSYPSLILLLILLILILPILLINFTGPDRIAKLNFDVLLNFYEMLNSLFFFVSMSYTVPRSSLSRDLS